LVKGASAGEGLGNKFLSQIRNVGAIVHVVRCIENKDIAHVDGAINPVRDVATIHTELILKDIESIDNRIKSVGKLTKSGDNDAKCKFELLIKIGDYFNKGNLIVDLELSDDERLKLKSFFLLTAKPVIFVANISDDILINQTSQYYESLSIYIKKRK